MLFGYPSSVWSLQPMPRRNPRQRQRLESRKLCSLKLPTKFQLSLSLLREPLFWRLLVFLFCALKPDQQRLTKKKKKKKKKRKPDEKKKKKKKKRFSVADPTQRDSPTGSHLSGQRPRPGPEPKGAEFRGEICARCVVY